MAVTESSVDVVCDAISFPFSYECMLPTVVTILSAAVEVFVCKQDISTTGSWSSTGQTQLWWTRRTRPVQRHGQPRPRRRQSLVTPQLLLITKRLSLKPLPWQPALNVRRRRTRLSSRTWRWKIQRQRTRPNSSLQWYRTTEHWWRCRHQPSSCPDLHHPQRPAGTSLALTSPPVPLLRGLTSQLISTMTSLL